MPDDTQREVGVGVGVGGGGEWRSVGGDQSRWRKTTLMKLLGRFMTRQYSEVQKNNGKALGAITSDKR